MARSTILVALLVVLFVTIQPGECEEDYPCKVTVKMTKEVPGKCVRLHGNRIGCVADGFLDMTNNDCYGM
uniref:Secreted protein n=1 Tax=Steinernema glaseri TaxID=37863 RepID=A0A1I7ZAM8_9BILA